MNLKFLKKKKRFIKGNSKIKPNLYWKYILYIAFLLVFISFIFGFYLFMKINKELTLPVVKTSEKEMIKKEKIDNVLNFFKEREKKSIRILNSPSPIVDPSL